MVEDPNGSGASHAAKRGTPKASPYSGGSASPGKAPGDGKGQGARKGQGAGKGRGLPLVFILCLLAIALGAVVIAPSFLKPSASAGGDPAAVYASIGGPFRMTDQDGRPADQHVLDGKWSAVFFGYVSCPDICPATMQTLADAQEKLGADAERFQVVFVSVDPERDRPKLLKTFLSEPGFPAHALGLTGAKGDVAAMAKAYRVYYAYTPRTAAQGGGYDVGHSGAIYLMNPKGKMAASLTEGQGPAAIADQIHAAMRGGA